MGLFSRNKEAAVDTTATEQEEKKQREAILNDAKFVESLNKRTDIDAETDVETLKKAHEAFKSKESVSRELQALFRNEIKNDTGLNLDVGESKEARDRINEFLEQELIDNPERITELKSQLAQFKETTQKVQEQKAKLERMGASLEGLQSKKEAMDKIYAAKKYFQFLRPKSDKYLKAREQGKDDHGIEFKKLSAQYDEVMRRIQEGPVSSEELSALQEQMNSARRDLLYDLAPMAALHSLAKDKVARKFMDLTDPSKPKSSTVAGIEEARALLDKVKNIDDADSKIDYLEGVDIDIIAEELDQKLEDSFKENMKTSVEKVKGSFGTLRRMQEVVKGLYKKEQLGDRTAEETKAFITSYLNDDLMPGLPNSQKVLLKFAMEGYE